MNNKPWIRLTSLILLPAILLASLPMDVLAQDSLTRSTTKIVERLTDASALRRYRNSYDAFIHELQLMMKELSSVNQKLAGELESSEEVSDRLKIIKTLNGKTSIVRSDLKNVRDVSFILSALPQVRTPMKLLYKSSKKTVKELKAFEKKIKPLHKKVTTFKQRILLKGIAARYALVQEIKFAQLIFNQSLLDSAKQMDDYIREAADCVDIEKDLSEISSVLDKLTLSITAFRLALSAINNALMKSSSLLTEIKLSLNSFKLVRSDLRTLEKIVRKIKRALRSLKKALKQKIQIKFSYDPPFGDLIRVKINLKLGDILKGPSVIMKLIEAKLGDFLWKVAKAFGIKKIVKRFLREAKRRVKKLLAKYRLDLDPDLDHLLGAGELIAHLEGLLKKLGGVYALPSLTFPERSGVNHYLGFLPHFQKLVLCKQIKEADLEIENVTIQGEVVRDTESMVEVKITNHQDIGILDQMSTTAPFDASLYDHKAVVTLESDAGYKYQTEEFLLKAGETKIVRIPWVPRQDGETRLISTVSIVDMKEKNLENNTRQISVAVAPAPVDLAVTEMLLEEDLTEAESSIIELNVKNLSSVDGAKARLRLTMGEKVLFESEEFFLDGQEEDVLEIEWTPEREGTFTVVAEVIPLPPQQDLQKDNNILRKSLFVKKRPIDLVIEDFIYEEEIYAGEKTVLRLRVRNKGPGATGDSVTLTIQGDEGYKKETRLSLKEGASREITYQWTPEKAGPVQFEIMLQSDREDLNDEDNSLLRSIEVRSREPGGFFNDLFARTEDMLNDFDRPQTEEEAREQLKKQIERLKTAYRQGNKSSFMGLFAGNFPDYAQFMRSVQQDFFFFRNIDVFYRLNSLTVSPDLKSAVADIYWEAQFMLRSGKIYRKKANIKTRFSYQQGTWVISGMWNNGIFGSSILSSVDLRLLLSGLSVGVSGLSIQLTGVVVQNRGKALAQNFRVRYTYTRSGGQQYTGYSTVSTLRASSQISLSYVFRDVAFVPALGDSLKIEIDPDRRLPEIELNNNTQTEYFPF